jgi:dTDP-4-dehydrorhamnose reductase
MAVHPSAAVPQHGPILVIGHRGMLGQDLLARLASSGMAAVGLDLEEIDITRSQQVYAITRDHHPSLVINCAAYTAVDQAESEPDLAFAVNRDGPQNLADACHGLGIPLIHISTDYVFDGEARRPYREDDAVNPINVYGHSKWEGEQAVRSRLLQHLIVRTAWLYGIHGHNFVKTILQLARDREELRVVADQYGSPTWTGDMSDALVAMARQVVADSGSIQWGNYHYCNAGETTWYDLARFIVEQARRKGPVKVTRVVPIASAEYPLPTPRPAYSVLDCTRIARSFGITPRPWPAALADMLKAL